MLVDISAAFRSLSSKDFRVLNGIEVGMKYHEWVPVEEISKYTKYTQNELHYLLKDLGFKGLLKRQTQPYEGYQIYFEGYDLLALNALVKRNSLCALGDEMGVGKESVVHEGLRDMVGGITQEPVIIKFHREGRTSFRQVKRKREHLKDVFHFSWIYAARLAARREYEVLRKLYPAVQVPEPIDHNRNVIVMGLAQGTQLSKTEVIEPEWYLDRIIEQIAAAYSNGVVHADLSEYNIFVSDERVTLIDWPQYVDVEQSHSDEILSRDVCNILSFFMRKYRLQRDKETVLNIIKSH